MESRYLLRSYGALKREQPGIYKHFIPTDERVVETLMGLDLAHLLYLEISRADYA